MERLVGRKNLNLEVDYETNHFDSIISDFLSHITDEKPITARQCIKALAQVGQAKPKCVPMIYFFQKGVFHYGKRDL